MVSEETKAKRFYSAVERRKIRQMTWPTDLFFEPFELYYEGQWMMRGKFKECVCNMAVGSGFRPSQEVHWILCPNHEAPMPAWLSEMVWFLGGALVLSVLIFALAKIGQTLERWLLG